MRKSLLLIAVLLLPLLTFAQTPTPHVPTLPPSPDVTPEVESNIAPADLAAAAKPFLGTFDAVSCQRTEDDKPLLVGLRFTIEQDAATGYPTVKLIQLLNPGEDLTAKNLIFKTLTFGTKADPDGANTRTLLYVINPNVSILFTPIKDKLLGIAGTDDGDTWPLGLALSTGDLKNFVLTNGAICSDGAVRNKFFGFTAPEPTPTPDPDTPAVKKN